MMFITPRPVGAGAVAPGLGNTQGLGRVEYVEGLPFAPDQGSASDFAAAYDKAVRDFNLNSYQATLLRMGGWITDVSPCNPLVADPTAFSQCLATGVKRTYNPRSFVDQIKAAGDLRLFTGDAGVAYATQAQVDTAAKTLAPTAAQTSGVSEPKKIGESGKQNAQPGESDMSAFNRLKQQADDALDKADGALDKAAKSTGMSKTTLLLIGVAGVAALVFMGGKK